jgi:GTPase Era involved in 16S rRNA processing|tara:strand:+ start:398 stop:607 length:210 start_codon:yes stop_codon:yes gene_type:complete
MTDEEKALYSFNIPSILVMNKVDLVTSKKRLRTLQNEIEDLCDFDKIFHVSCETQFGLDALKRFIVERG